MSKAKVGEIPGIKALRHRLGLGTPGDKESIHFGQLLKTFRKTYKTPDGTLGSSLMKWRDHHHQRGLSHMADEFLEKEGRGSQFWPDGEGVSYVKSLKWTRDRVMTQHHCFENIDELLDHLNRDDDDDDYMGVQLDDSHEADPYTVPSSPPHHNSQNSIPTDGPIKREPDAEEGFDWELSAATASTVPVAPTTKQPTPVPTNRPTPIETWSGRTRRQVERPDLVNSGDIDTDSSGLAVTGDTGFEGAGSARYSEQQAPSRLHPPPTEHTHPTIPRATDSAGVRPKRRILVTYSVQTSPRNYRLWDHGGSFGTMTMAEFEARHGFHNARMVHFVLQGPGMSWDDQVCQGDDFYFQQMKKRFKSKIWNDLAENRDGDEVVQYEILIEPVRDEESRQDFVREESICL
ncbi:Hypothetical protein NCS54_01015700 [Fusarium falciforme]|uniref:Hypothetical protein n=1 Tax=Fusarium falciforme TaxID=195108 RepID=UPI0023004A4C|nr:Hypothetical protein NCS54_01015700 [Fusarium falciforme]WAO92642.1 Hypothetical protein NCS54_01015700 [Fusarium falciforme]